LPANKSNQHIDQNFSRNGTEKDIYNGPREKQSFHLNK